MKPRSTTWVSKFLLIEYEDDQWVENFKMLKSTLFQIVHRLKPTLLKKHKVHKSHPHGDSCVMCYLQTCAWLQFLNLYSIICNWEVYRILGPTWICCYNKYIFLEVDFMASGSIHVHCHEWFQTIVWPT